MYVGFCPNALALRVGANITSLFAQKLIVELVKLTEHCPTTSLETNSKANKINTIENMDGKCNGLCMVIDVNGKFTNQLLEK